MCGYPTELLEDGLVEKSQSNGMVHWHIINQRNDHYDDNEK